MEIDQMNKIIFEDNVDLLREFNVQDIKSHNPPLILEAIKRKANKCLDYLLSSNFDPYVTDGNDDGILNYIAQYENIDALILLKNYSVSIEAIGHLVLRQANTHFFNQLLQRGLIELAYKDFIQETLLHIASQMNDVEIAEILIRSGQINVSDENYEGRTALHFAAGNGNEILVQLLLSCPRVNRIAKDKFGKTPLHYAIVQSNIKIAEILLGRKLNSFDSDDRTLLMSAARNDDVEITSYLIEIPEVDVNMQNKNGLAALHFAAKFQSYKVLDLLVGSPRININIQDLKKKTAMHYAVEDNLINVAKILTRNKKIRLDILDEDGRDALSYQVSNE